LKFAVFKIDGMEFKKIQTYFSNIIHIHENSVNICEEYFGLPGYHKIQQLLEEYVEGGRDSDDEEYIYMRER
jgi:hypothetical protein